MGTKSKKKKAPKAKAAEEKPARLSKHHQRMLMPACSTLENKVLKGLDWGDDRCGCEEAGYSPWGYHRCQKVQAALPAKERDPHLTPEFILDGVRAHTAYTCLQYLKNKLIHVLDWPARSPYLKSIERTFGRCCSVRWAIVTMRRFCGDGHQKKKNF